MRLTDDVQTTKVPTRVALLPFLFSVVVRRDEVLHLEDCVMAFKLLSRVIYSISRKFCKYCW